MPAEMPNLTSADEWPDPELDALRVRVLSEQERRQCVAAAPAQVADLVRASVAAGADPDALIAAATDAATA